MSGDWLMFGAIFAFLALVGVCVALMGFPVYFLAKEKQRSGEKTRVVAVVGALVIGLMGAVAIWLFLFAKG